MVDVEVYEIGGEEFYLLDEVKISGNSYLCLSNVKDEKDVMFRKRDKEDPNLLHPLDDIDEVRKVSLILSDKVLSGKE